MAQVDANAAIRPCSGAKAYPGIPLAQVTAVTVPGNHGYARRPGTYGRPAPSRPDHCFG
jgi:hypothetical protein